MKKYTGLNIQFPISQLILDEKKTIETRTYCLPEKFLNQELLIVETPGKTGKFKSRIVGIIIFNNSFPYKTKASFYKDEGKHFVNKESPWAWKDKPKWGWEIAYVKKFQTPIELTKRPGIVFTSDLKC